MYRYGIAVLGKRPLHQKAIAANREMYDWIERRIEAIQAYPSTPQHQNI